MNDNKINKYNYSLVYMYLTMYINMQICGYMHRWPKLPICVGNDYSGVRLHIAILSKCMGNLNSSHNVMKNNKIHCLPQASCVVVTPCVYGRFWSRLEAN